MNIIYFTHHEIQDAELIPGFLAGFGDQVFMHTDRIDLDVLEQYQADFIVSDRARYLIRQPVLERLQNRVINLHPSYLPYNRGYNPQFWSVIEGTPSGVTVHYIDEGIDTGDIIAQQQVQIDESDTLRTGYDKHRDAMVGLFKSVWPDIRQGTNSRQVQPKEGTLHYKRDLDGIVEQLPQGWDTPVTVAKSMFAQEGLYASE